MKEQVVTEKELSLFLDFEENVEDAIFSKMTIEGDPPIEFRYGLPGEEEEIQNVANKFSKEVGWVKLAQISLWIDKKWCVVATCDNKIVGFNLLTVVKRGRTGLTSNNIGLLPDYLRRGIGRKFREYAIELLEKKGWQTILAKCIQSSKANYLNQSMGFKLIKFDPGKKKALNVWCYYNQNIPESYHKPDLSDQFDWSLVDKEDEPIKKEKKGRKKSDIKDTVSTISERKIKGQEYIDSLPMEEIVLEYRRTTWKGMREKLGYSSSVINRLRKSERFREAYPELAK